MHHPSNTHKINLVTLGCSKNLVDSEVLMRQIKANNIEILHDSNEITETVIINTCGFILDAKQESIDTILQFADARKKGIVKNLLVMGCLSERYKSELITEIPEVDAFYGVSDFARIINDLGFDFRKDLLGERLLTTPAHYAYLKIAEGCNQHCSFCAIPAIRGNHQSRNIEEIIREVEKLAAKGVKELILISQDLTYYGLDLYKSRKLPELVDTLCKIEGIEWIRLHYLHPAGFPQDLIPVIRDNKKVCNYIDIPLQHINTNILRSMRRGVDKKQTIELIRKIREEIPEAYIRTAFIIGYPGETSKRYEELKEFIHEMKFERLGLFAYSPEEGTSSFSMRNIVSKKVVQTRIDELMSLQQSISHEKNMNRIGHTLKVMIDRKEGEYYIGRTEYDSPEVDNEVLIESKAKNLSGHLLDVRINGADTFDLFGNIV
ncbi:MAG: 30S ribosomal protein S12 methylthiotransferase RimO [Bacteroidales bacterium]|nr:30S ribosomal protein S12 methylthiotransferase RimO [Bacteroidales bacterium]MCF8387322.1 30S ribosomal protein S12 methylthiotransferase RimO [Bacteroidales bacterium]MCF8398046.1 30S ribosomal protein S12 methylthiotransferase RimO [Bacteroidales bacterium]